MIIAPPPVPELNTVSSLLAVISDPVRSAEALAGMRAAADEYRALAAAAEQDRLEAVRARAAAQEAADAAARDRNAAAAARAAVEARARDLAAREKDLEAREAVFAEQSAKAADDLKRREDTVSQREAMAANATAEVNETKRVCDALIAEYNEKIAKLRALAG
jgi:hypothetical protein